MSYQQTSSPWPSIATRSCFPHLIPANYSVSLGQAMALVECVKADRIHSPHQCFITNRVCRTDSVRELAVFFINTPIHSVRILRVNSPEVCLQVLTMFHHSRLRPYALCQLEYPVEHILSIP